MFTHRDPVKSVTSYASLTTLVREASSDEVDRYEIASDWTARLHRVINHALDVREAREYPDAMLISAAAPTAQFPVAEKCW